MVRLNTNKEAQIEEHLINLLCEGYGQWVYRSDLKNEADLWRNLRGKIELRNKSELGDISLTDHEFELIKSQILASTKTPFEAAKWLRGEKGKCSIVLERDNNLGKVELVLYLSSEKNGGFSSYEIVNQIAKDKSKLEDRNRRFDVTLLISGLPIIQIELKTSTAKDGVKQAYYQIEKYIDEGTFNNTIFQTLQLFVMSNEQTTRYMAAAPSGELQEKFMFSWRTTDNVKVDNIDEFAKQVLNIPMAHQLVTEYMLVSEEQNNKLLMVLHPYQIHAINAIYNSAKRHESGYIWHATGSGKTLTSFVTTKLLAQKPGIDRTIMLLDRKDLDNQTTSEFTKFATAYSTGSSNALIVGTGSANQLLKGLTSDTNANTVLITTRQKLNQALIKLSEENPKKLEELRNKHIVFIVDECHRAISSENMEEIKRKLPKSTWFGLTGTPIFEVNKKSADGQYARTTRDQYGEVLHHYTIKNALEDGAVLGFQVEHESTIPADTLHDIVFSTVRSEEKYINFSDEQLYNIVSDMDDIEKEKYVHSSQYESDKHIDAVVKKILSPNNAYHKFVFREGKPTMSAILTTSSIDMAKRYYKAIKKFTYNKDWLEEKYKDHPLRQGMVMNDPDFPRIAITYSLDENAKQSAKKESEMAEIINDYNKRYGTSWSLESINRYNADINNRLARKKGEFKQFGNHLDLVIVVDRLLTGFDAPRCQTLFVDRNLQYAGLIQAFSRTNRTYKGKEKGLITTFRKPATMKEHVYAATRLYSQENTDSSLIYPSYDESKKKFNEAYNNIIKLNALNVNNPISEHDPLSERIKFVECFQALNKAYKAISSYDEFNIELEKDSKGSYTKKIAVLEDNIGLYNTIKASIVSDDSDTGQELQLINFFDSSTIKTYTVDKTYIDALLNEYAPNSESTRAKIEDALNKLNKSVTVRATYKKMLDDIDTHKVDSNQGILKIKRQYFTREYECIVHNFVSVWCVDFDELMLSVSQTSSGDEMYNRGNIMKSLNFPLYAQNHADADPFSTPQYMIEAWEQCLFNEVIPMKDELI